MQRRVWLFASLALIALGAWSCSTMAKMMGMGDLMNAMVNMDQVMGMQPDEMRQYVMSKQAAALQ